MSQIQLHLGDCLDFLKGLPEGCVDAVVTDPPYNVGIRYGVYNDTNSDYECLMRQWFAQVRRVCQGLIIFTCGIANLGLWHRIEKPRWVLCWWKPASTGRCAVGFNNWEPLLLYGAGKIRVTCDVIRTTEQAKLGARHKTHPIDHPCPKPLEWASRLVDLFTDRQQIILDPFMGSGTTGVACIQTGRRFIGCEIDPTYFAIAEKRIANARHDMPLFAETQAECLVPQ